MPRSFVPLTFLEIFFPTFQSEYFGDSINIEIKPTPYMISHLVTVKYIRLATILLNNVGSTVDPSSYLLNFKHVITGVGVVLQVDMLNLFKTTLAYFDYDIKIPLLDY